jgi:hypothetical protein
MLKINSLGIGGSIFKLIENWLRECVRTNIYKDIKIRRLYEQSLVANQQDIEIKK